MKNFRYTFFAIAGCCLVLAGMQSCRDNDDPAPERIYTDADFSSSTLVTIQELKDMYGKGLGLGEGTYVTGDYVIRGKVISSDRNGNIYRTMYIQDETAGIEIKIGTTGNYNYYQPGRTLYIKAQGLVMGNYRHMLSLGSFSTNTAYANNYIDVKAKIENTIFKGANTKMEVGDTVVITDYTKLSDRYLGMLVRIEGATHKYGTYNNSDYPSFLESKEAETGETVYADYTFQDAIAAWEVYYAEYAVWEKKGKPADGEPKVPSAPEPGTLLYPTYAFKNDNDNYYGSALFKYGSSDTDATQNLVVRSSGYSRFALDPLPADGAEVDITAIYTKYSSASGGFLTYQLLLNSVSDVVVRMPDEQ